MGGFSCCFQTGPSAYGGFRGSQAFEAAERRQLYKAVTDKDVRDHEGNAAPEGRVPGEFPRHVGPVVDAEVLGRHPVADDVNGLDQAVDGLFHQKPYDRDGQVRLFGFRARIAVVIPVLRSMAEGVDQGGPPHRVAMGQRRAAFSQKRQDVLMAADCSVIDRPSIIGIRLCVAGAGFKQQPHFEGIAHPGGDDERRSEGVSMAVIDIGCINSSGYFGSAKAFPKRAAEMGAHA